MLWGLPRQSGNHIGQKLVCWNQMEPSLSCRPLGRCTPPGRCRPWLSSLLLSPFFRQEEGILNCWTSLHDAHWAALLEGRISTLQGHLQKQRNISTSGNCAQRTFGHRLLPAGLLSTSWNSRLFTILSFLESEWWSDLGFDLEKGPMSFGLTLFIVLQPWLKRDPVCTSSKNG